ncbi:YlmH/Sll1252 family protein [Alkalibaculum bacchi]|uniref:YlmH/Sll1252 family protein n=1 Tax=Alkalibaculum bacchi TaxID=645887 RepID=UPI0026EAFC1B|nr:YlmH/Sll1252 family protein [Alkalibaculum bacchi]
MSQKYNNTDIMVKKISYQAKRLSDGLAFFDFCDPSQQGRIEGELKHEPIDFSFFGGHEFCERKMLCLLAEEIGGEIPWPIALCKCEVDFEVHHRMVLGAVMSLGIAREIIGDIIIDEKCIQIVVKEHIAEFIAVNFDRLSNRKIQFEVLPISQIEVKEPEFEFGNISIASFRLDAIISSACGISREAATDLIKGGRVKINHEEKTKSSQIAKIGDLFSVKGKGRFILEEFTGTTKKGRNKIVIKKYV